MLSRPLCLAVLLAIVLAVHAAAARAASSSVLLAAKGEAKLLAGDVGGAARTLLKASVKAPYNATLAALALQPKDMPPLEVELPAVNDPNKVDSEVRLSWGVGTRHDRPTLMQSNQNDTPRRRPAVHRAAV